MDINQWLDNIETVSTPQENAQAAAAAAAAATAATAAMAPARPSENSDEQYVRIGRRTSEDEEGDIPTQYIVVAKIEKKKKRVTWFSVATWLLNGLRIGSLDAGDQIREDEHFDLSTGLDPDPYFFARNLLSPRRIREHLLELLAQDDLWVQDETYDDEMAQTERNQAQWARMMLDDGIAATTKGMKAVAGQNPRRRFPAPWDLPAVLNDAWDTTFIGIKPGPTTARRRRAKQEWLPTFDSMGKGASLSVNVIAVFVNDFDDKNLRLTHFIEVAFEAEESFESAKVYFLEGDGGKFGGLNDHSYLAQWQWSLELWVLPQKDRCSSLVKWDDVPRLTARAFCDWRAIHKDGAAKLYLEVRIVEHKSRVSSPIESEADVISD